VFSTSLLSQQIGIRKPLLTPHYGSFSIIGCRPTKLLNYITAPDTIIWSALLASAAVPGILNPVVLMQKLKDGRAVPWNWGSRFKDGSLRCVFTLAVHRLC
jgi:hypothetical protein